MQPNPVDTTNGLLVQLIQISLYGPSAAQPATLSASTGYSSANFWTQALAYTSLAFSLLAAFGAVLGKRWLGYYKATCYGRGSLEDRCQQRHRRFQGLQTWQFENMLQSFPFLLQMSLLLFGLSLGAAMWTQQQTISILIIATTAMGTLCHVFTIIVSLISPDCPFQTPVSLAIQAILRRYRKSASSQHHKGDSNAAAMQWIFETSTNPDIVMSAAELIPAMSKHPDVDIVSLCAEVRDMFQACFDRRGILILQDNAMAYGKALIHFSWNFPDARLMLQEKTQYWNLWKSWHTLHFPQALGQCFMSYDRMKGSSSPNSLQRYQGDTSTALRTAVSAGILEFTDPNDRRLIWHGQFRLHHSHQDIDRLMGCVEHFYHVDIDVAGDALLLATGSGIAMPESPFLDFDVYEVIRLRITPLLNASHRSPRWRCIALHAACRILASDARHGRDESFLQAVMMAIYLPVDHTKQDECDTYDFLFNGAMNLINSTKWPEGNDLALSPLPEIQHLVLRVLDVLPTPKVDNPANYTPYCRAFIRLMDAGKHSSIRGSALHIACNVRQDLAMITAAGIDASLREMVLSELSPALLAAAAHNSDDYHLLIFALAKSPDWRYRLIRDGHVEKCIPMIYALEYRAGALPFYLAGFFLRIAPPGQATRCCRDIKSEQWWLLFRIAWRVIGDCGPDALDDGIEILPTLVKGTKRCMPKYLRKGDLGFLNQYLGDTLEKLGPLNPAENIVSAVMGLKDTVHGRWEAASE